MTLTHGIKVAIATDFLNSFSKVPKGKQAKVIEFINKFRAEPTSSGINYEKIQGAGDPNLRSVRIDQTYRGVVLKPDSGNVYVLLWIDHHDKAYQWAQRKSCTIHPETGSLQVIDVEDAKAVEPTSVERGGRSGLFAEFRDHHLVRLGVPEILLPLVRSLQTEEALDCAAEHLPQEVSEALMLLAAGYSFDETLEEIEKGKAPASVDLSDFEAALEQPDSKRRFWVVEDDLELAAMLEAPLEKWRIFLHPSQRSLVERNWNGAVRVLGGAGTGKTVVAMHRAKWLAEKVFFSPNDRILFTTFTRNLAADIQENLSKICLESDVIRRIEVVNLDRWVSEFLKRNGYGYEIDYGSRTADLWKRALTLAPAELGLPESFYREEWERVIQPQGISTLLEYFGASRLGRGIALTRKYRKAAWTVFEEYRNLLNEQGLRESDDAMRDARLILESKGDILPYRSVIVDEAQDMGAQAFRLIRALAQDEGNNDLFIVGDAHQRIYRHRVTLSHCGINIRGRGRRLRINYRTTEETRRWAVGLLKGMSVDDLDGGKDDQRGYKSLLHGVDPTIRHFANFQEESGFIVQYLLDLAAANEDLRGVCLVARTHDLLKQYESALNAGGIETYFIRRSEAEDLTASGLRLATMHRVKGLEFQRVIIASINEGVIPLEHSEMASADPTVRKQAENRERALLYVSATRATREVLVTSFGKPSRFLTSGC